MNIKWNKKDIQQTFDRLLEIFNFNDWAIKLEFVEHDWKNTGNVKVDVEGKTAIVYLNVFNPKMENYEQVLIHELCHIKLWKLDQYCESLLNSTFEDKNSVAYKFGYDQFMLHLEQTTEELTITILNMIGKDKNLSFNRCEERMNFKEEEKEI